MRLVSSGDASRLGPLDEDDLVRSLGSSEQSIALRLSRWIGSALITIDYYLGNKIKLKLQTLASKINKLPLLVLPDHRSHTHVFEGVHGSHCYCYTVTYLDRFPANIS